MGLDAGLVWALVYVGIAVVGAVAGYLIASSYTPGEMQVDPLQQLQTTTAREGTVVPIVYGTVRLAGNIMYYGGLKSIPHYEPASGGGKGSSPDAVQSGYDYYLNVWQGICMGKIEMLGHIINDDPERKLRTTETIFNDGTNGLYPNWLLGGVIEATALITGSTPNFNLGHTHIQKNTVSFTVPIAMEGSTPGQPNYTFYFYAVKDNGAGGIVSAGGIPLAGWTINYTTGALTAPGCNLAGVTAHYYYGDTAESAAFYAGPLTGMAHVAYRNWHVGANVYHVPTVHFIVKRILSSPVSHANMANGSNPAAVIYDILTNRYAGSTGDPLVPVASPADINLASFNAAAAYWNTQGYGLNFAVSQQMEVSTLIERILGWVGGSLYMDDLGRYALHAFNPDDEATVELTQDDFVDLQMTRNSWESTKNDLRFTYTDALGAYQQRTFGLYDRANAATQGGINQSTVDLTCFNNITTVSKRAWEILKTSSYPGLVFTFKLLETKGVFIHVGKVVSISHAQYGISNAKFRITKMELSEADGLEVSFTAEQMIEALIDATFGQPVSTVPAWVPTSYAPVPLPFSRVFELPWTPTTLDEPHYALLGARAGIENGLVTHMSIVGAGSDYHYHTTTRIFSQYGTLDEAYPADTFEIDDEVGIIYTPYRNDLDPADMLRKEAFLGRRFVLIGNELMSFQVHAPHGEGAQFRITGVIRGMFGTPVSAHSAGAPVWIFVNADLFTKIVQTSPFWLKMIPVLDQTSAEAGDVAAVAVTPTQKAAAPPAIAMVIAVVSGSTMSCTWWPATRQHPGAGMAAENATADTWPPLADGDFEYRINTDTPVNILGHTVALAISASLTFSVRQRINARYSDWKGVSVVNAEGTYLSEVGGITY